LSNSKENENKDNELENEGSTEDTKKEDELSDELLDSEEVDPEKMEEILEELPGEEKKVLRKLMISSSSMTSSPFPPQLANSINEKHIDKLLDISGKAEDREFKLKNKQENHRLIYVILGIALFVFLTIFLAKDSQDIFLDVLKIGLGFLGGWGAGTYKKNK
jgi:hypothetical protein